MALCSSVGGMCERERERACVGGMCVRERERACACMCWSEGETTLRVIKKFVIQRVVMHIWGGYDE